ncbi:MAG: hypothetical protein KC457_03090, partial [Myxococcales bacterium]|nr:hypothetical protein [Myxococcales bacterium]
EVERLRATLAQATRDHVRELTAARASAGAGTSESERLRRLRLEVQVRTSEQEYMLAALDSAEQKIWEMTDASDRNAARFAASLAQLEKHKETVDSLLDELEVTRNLLAAEQARALEHERMLASERAKMARAGLIEGFPSAPATNNEDPFADFEESLTDLGGGKKASVVKARAPSKNPGVPGKVVMSKSGRVIEGPGPTAQELDHALASLTDDDDDEDDFDLEDKPAKPAKPAAKADDADPDAPVARTQSRSSSATQANQSAGQGTPSSGSSTPGSGPHTRAREDSGRGRSPTAAVSRPRMTVEEVDDDEWED